MLTRISHQLSTAAVDPGMSTALRSVGLLDVLSSTPEAPSSRAPCIHARLRRLATKSGEKSGLTSARSSHSALCVRFWPRTELPVHLLFRLHREGGGLKAWRGCRQLDLPGRV